MSYITDVTMLLGTGREKVLEHVQSFSWGENGQLGRVAYFGKLDSDKAGGSKVYCSSVYVAAFNFLPVAEFLDHLKAAPWNPYSFNVVVLTTEGEFQTIFRPGHDLIEEDHL